MPVGDKHSSLLRIYGQEKFHNIEPGRGGRQARRRPARRRDGNSPRRSSPPRHLPRFFSRRTPNGVRHRVPEAGRGEAAAPEGPVPQHHQLLIGK